MALIVLRGLNGQNDKGWSLFDKGYTNREKMGEGKTPNKRVSKQHYNLACIFFKIKNYSHFCGCL